MDTDIKIPMEEIADIFPVIILVGELYFGLWEVSILHLGAPHITLKIVVNVLWWAKDMFLWNSDSAWETILQTHLQPMYEQVL